MGGVSLSFSLLEKHQKEYVDPPENALILVLWAVKRGSLVKPLVGVNSADADVSSSVLSLRCCPTTCFLISLSAVS